MQVKIHPTGKEQLIQEQASKRIARPLIPNDPERTRRTELIAAIVTQFEKMPIQRRAAPHDLAHATFHRTENRVEMTVNR